MASGAHCCTVHGAKRVAGIAIRMHSPSGTCCANDMSWNTMCVVSTHSLLQSVCRIVPERTAFVIERFGKYAKTLQPGLHLLIPVVGMMTCDPHPAALNCAYGGTHHCIARSVVCVLLSDNGCLSVGGQDSIHTQPEGDCHPDSSPKRHHQGQCVHQHRWHLVCQGAQAHTHHGLATPQVYTCAAGTSTSCRGTGADVCIIFTVDRGP